MKKFPYNLPMVNSHQNYSPAACDFPRVNVGRPSV